MWCVQVWKGTSSPVYNIMACEHARVEKVKGKCTKRRKPHIEQWVQPFRLNQLRLALDIGL